MLGKDMRGDVGNKEVGRKKNRAQHMPAFNSQPLCHSRALFVIPSATVIPAEAGIQIIKNY